MHLETDKVYHIYNTDNNMGIIFFQENNYLLFKDKLNHLIIPYCELLCWCLMPNHFHLMIQATESGCQERNSFGGKPMQIFSYKTGVLLSSYSQLMNKQNKTTGSLFQQKTKSKLLSTENDIIRCMHYIHQNPLRAGLVKRLEEWRHSSFGAYAYRNESGLCNVQTLFHLTGYNKEQFAADSYKVVEDNQAFY